MTKRGLVHATGLLGLGLVLSVMSGCGSSSRGETDILPSQETARAALTEALAAWKNGQKMGRIEGSSHDIEVVDSTWQEGAQLASFEILQALDKPGPRWFSVKLTLRDSPEPQQVQYAVYGLDPLWVFRAEDYDAKSSEM
jgi:hypothetical protein